MLRVFKVIWFFLLIVSCKSKDVGYINYDNWEVPEEYSYSKKLNGNPKEVKEIVYTYLSDTTLNAEGKSSGYQLYKFDSSGNIVFLKTHIDSLYETNFTYQYTKNGPQFRAASRDINSSSMISDRKSASAKIGRNKFEITDYYKDTVVMTKAITFDEERRWVKEERWKKGTLLNTVTSYYYDDKLKRREINKKEGIESEDIYYYSDKGFLDSISFYFEGKRVGQYLFINNEHGDPVYFEETNINKNYKTDKAWMKYQYDNRGNWIKKIVLSTREQHKYSYYGQAVQKYPEYELTVREIKY